MNVPKKIGDCIFVGDKIGKGTYGDVFAGTLIRNGHEKAIAIKLESLNKKEKYLDVEIEIYKQLRRKTGFAKKFGDGRFAGFNFLAIELLGPSLQKLFNDCHKKFDIDTICKIGVQIVDRLENLHDLGIIHCDLKPDNMAVGLNDSSKLFLIDFGLAMTLQNLNVPLRLNSTRGSLMYCAIGAHEGYISFKNDVESLGYVLAFMAKGELPWVGKNTLNHGSKKAIANNVYKIKKSQFDDFLISLPLPIAAYLSATQDLTHTQRPDYQSLCAILK